VVAEVRLEFAKANPEGLVRLDAHPEVADAVVENRRRMISAQSRVDLRLHLHMAVHEKGVHAETKTAGFQKAGGATIGVDVEIVLVETPDEIELLDHRIVIVPIELRDAPDLIEDRFAGGRGLLNRASVGAPGAERARGNDRQE